MLKFSRTDYDAIRQHGEETYPHECCGVLLGRFEDDGSRTVATTARCGNTRTDSAHNRYNIDPKELVRIQREGRDRGEDIVGFYHSHPDHPAQWSKTDHDEAHWIGCSYVITAVEEGKAEITNSFELSGSDESDKRLVDEVIKVHTKRKVKRKLPAAKRRNSATQGASAKNDRGTSKAHRSKKAGSRGKQKT